MWKVPVQPKNPRAYVPDFKAVLPPLKIYPRSIWSEFCSPEFLESFTANKHPHDILKLSTARLSGHPQVVQFYRNHETPDTALFGNFEPCPNSVAVSFGKARFEFTNSECAFQAAKVLVMLEASSIAEPAAEAWIEALSLAADGEKAWPTIKRINGELCSSQNLAISNHWHTVSRDVMFAVVRAKMSQNPIYAAALVSQRGKVLIENSGDQRGNWSISPNHGYVGGSSGINWLGNALMEAAADPAVLDAAALSPIPLEQFCHSAAAQSSHLAEAPAS